MLAEEQLGHRYNKARHNAALVQRIGRTRASIEFKHRNISAVLRELGMPDIAGYKPATNYQDAIFGAIDRHLTSRPDPLPLVRESAMALAESTELYLEAPPPLVPARPRPAALERLVRKFDPALRDERNRSLGKAGEQLIYDFERRQLELQDRPDLARKVRWVAQEDGDGAGYDIRSFDARGTERLIEVKTTQGMERTPFYLTRNERTLSDERPDAFRLYRLYQFSKQPRLFELRPPLDSVLALEPLVFKASLTS
ncbi:MAG: DUF3883 domain-containing protein [Alphaproteobacteria bacterium]|nr:DUF3883 domain-containing protein [Alphaproteobacteria bacterium]MCW5743457.1 DUF3883 domain-containing protein [Alphaproteobacteria bacterium]